MLVLWFREDHFESVWSEEMQIAQRMYLPVTKMSTPHRGPPTVNQERISSSQQGWELQRLQS